MLDIATSTVSPVPQPGPRYRMPKRTPIVDDLGGRRRRRSSRPMTAFAITREMPCSSPSSRRRRRRSVSSPGGSTTTKTSPPRQIDLVRRDVVGERVEGPPRHEVEPGVVPVAREQARLHGAPVEREAHVRAPVLDRVGAAVVPEDAYRSGADLAGELSRLLELLERSASSRGPVATIAPPSASCVSLDRGEIQQEGAFETLSWSQPSFLGPPLASSGLLIDCYTLCR